jgi:hypothetical protein
VGLKLTADRLEVTPSRRKLLSRRSKLDGHPPDAGLLVVRAVEDDERVPGLVPEDTEAHLEAWAGRRP